MSALTALAQYAASHSQHVVKPYHAIIHLTLIAYIDG
jgi:hypothetical protein